LILAGKLEEKITHERNSTNHYKYLRQRHV
jgi:hypothetical protein